MSTVRTRVAVAAAAVLLLVAGAVGPAGGSAPAAGSPSAAAPPANATAGSIVATGVTAQGDSLGTPLESPDGRFDGAFYGRVASFAAAYNERQPDLGPAAGVATGEVVNLHVVAPDGDRAVVSFHLTDDNRITDLRAGPREDAAVRIEMDEATFDRVATADDPSAAFERALADGEVTVTRRGALAGPIESLFDVIADLLG